MCGIAATDANALQREVFLVDPLENRLVFEDAAMHLLELYVRIVKTVVGVLVDTELVWQSLGRDNAEKNQYGYAQSLNPSDRRATIDQILRIENKWSCEFLVENDISRNFTAFVSALVEALHQKREESKDEQAAIFKALASESSFSPTRWRSIDSIDAAHPGLQMFYKANQIRFPDFVDLLEKHVLPRWEALKKRPGM